MKIDQNNIQPLLASILAHQKDDGEKRHEPKF